MARERRRKARGTDRSLGVYQASPEQRGAGLIDTAGSQPPVEPSEPTGEHKRHNQDACPQDEHMLRVAQIEIADATNEQVADGKVEEAP